MNPLKKMLAAAAALLLAGTAQAATMTVGGPGTSLHGATGSLTVESDGGNGWIVDWEIDFTNFGLKTDGTFEDTSGHEYLTSVAFKAFANDSITAVTVASVTFNGVAQAIPVDAILYPSKVSSGGCVDPSSADFVCVSLDVPGQDATSGGVYNVRFAVEGGKVLEDEWSFRGKYGPRTGWVISESAPPVPEPTSALVFGAGTLVLAAGLRRKS